MDTIAHKGYLIRHYLSWDTWCIVRAGWYICSAKDLADAKRIIDTELNPGHSN